LTFIRINEAPEHRRLKSFIKFDLRRAPEANADFNKEMKNSSTITFIQNNKIRSIDMEAQKMSPTTTVLNYLRNSLTHKGTKEGCAEGDCGACTVVLAELDENKNLRYTALDSCLVFLPMIHGKQLITVEDLETIDDKQLKLHPVQQCMVDSNGSQCGYCTPGFIMSLFSLYKNEQTPDQDSISDALTGNLCRCTGYRPIIESAAKACVHRGKDHFNAGEDNIVALLENIKKDKTGIKINLGIQNYSRPIDLHEALRQKTIQPESIIITGATDVALRVTKKREVLKDILDLGALNEIKYYRKNKDTIEIGAGLDLETIRVQTEKDLPALHKMLNVFGSRQIRRLATLGGNIGSASPIGDTLPVLMAYDANVILKNISGERSIPLTEFITGYRQTQRNADEIITCVRIPIHQASHIIASYKVSKRKDLDISTLSVAFRLVLKDSLIAEILIVYGGMAEKTKQAKKAEAFLIGKKWCRETIEEAAEVIYNEFTPLNDARSGAEFRRIAAKNLLIKFWSENK